MMPNRFMIIAGEASGDALAAELVLALKQTLAGQGGATFFGAGGPKLAAAGVELATDMTAHSVIGLQEAIRSYFTFKRIMDDLLRLALERKPDVIICVDFSGFNRRFAHTVRQRIRSLGVQWNPKIVQYVSPQVWASRPGRARAMAEDIDLLLCTFPFEPAWYQRRVPKLKVEFVGNPIIDRYAKIPRANGAAAPVPENPLILLLPASRTGELRRHLPLMLEVAKQIQARHTKARFRMVLPDERLAQAARWALTALPGLEIRTGDLVESLREASLAISKTGTITLELGYFRVPSVALYKTSWFTYLIGKMIVTVKYAAMPNLLADEVVFPEFIQHTATAANIVPQALELLENGQRRAAVQGKLDTIINALGSVGAAQRAASAILGMK